MFGLGDIVSRAGSSRRLLVVDIEGAIVWVAWHVDGRPRETQIHRSALVLVQQAPNTRDDKRPDGRLKYNDP